MFFAFSAPMYRFSLGFPDDETLSSVFPAEIRFSSFIDSPASVSKVCRGSFLIIRSIS